MNLFKTSYPRLVEALRGVISGRPLSVPTGTAVQPWFVQPVVNLEEQGNLEAAIQGTSVESRAKSARLLLEKKKKTFLCESLIQASSNNVRSLMCVAELQSYSANRCAVFTNSEFSLKYIEVYGFDFDYTLAHYSKQLDKFIYQQARNALITKLNV